MNNICRCTSCDKKADSRCAGCSQVYYCSFECQRKDWDRHKSECSVSCEDVGIQLPTIKISKKTPKSIEEAAKQMISAIKASPKCNTFKGKDITLETVLNLENEQERQLILRKELKLIVGLSQLPFISGIAECKKIISASDRMKQLLGVKS